MLHVSSTHMFYAGHHPICCSLWSVKEKIPGREGGWEGGIKGGREGEREEGEGEC